MTRPHAKQIREAARLILEARRPVLYVGGGVIRAGASPGAAGARGADRDAGRHHADGPRRLPRQPRPAPRHARACTAPSPRSPALQRSDLIISLGARFDDRVTGNLDSFAPARQGHPRRHRPGRDRQEPARRRADRRRRPRGDRRPGRRAAQAEAEAGNQGDYEAWVRVPGRGEEEVPARLRPARRRVARRRSTSSSGSARSPGPEAIYVSGRRPAPDVGRALRRLRAPAAPGSTPAASARWASRCRPRWAPRSAGRTRPCGRSTATAASR